MTNKTTQSKQESKSFVINRCEKLLIVIMKCLYDDLQQLIGRRRINVTSTNATRCVKKSKTMHFNLYLPLFAHELKTNMTTKIEKKNACEFEGKMAEEQLHLSVTVSNK